MPTFVKLSAFRHNLYSGLMGLKGLSFDLELAIDKAEKSKEASISSKEKALRSWIKRSVSENDTAVLNYGTPTLKQFLSKQELFDKRDMLWEHWGVVRLDALQKHGIQDPGLDAEAKDILKWCSDIRHILSDVTRFEGMAARVSGRTKIKKHIADMEDVGGLTSLELAWSDTFETQSFDLNQWLLQQADIISAIDASEISKEKKEIILYHKRLDKVMLRINELVWLKTQVSYWCSCLNELFVHSDRKLDLDEVNWFFDALRKVTSDISHFCYTMDATKKPDTKMLKKSYARIKQ